MNPFQLVHKAIWEVIDGNALLVDTLKARNRIKFTSDTDRDPCKAPAAATDDFPELLIHELSSTANLHESSCNARVTKQFRFILSLGDWRQTAIQSELEWAIFCSLVQLQKIAHTIDWQGDKFVKRVDLLSTNVGEANPMRSPQIKGWAVVWVVEIEMRLAHSLIIAQLSQSSSSS